MQQCGRRPVLHAAVAVRGTGRHTFKEAEHPPHLVRRVQAADEGDLGSPGLQKHTVTSLLTSVCIMLLAPFMYVCLPGLMSGKAGTSAAVDAGLPEGRIQHIVRLLCRRDGVVALAALHHDGNFGGNEPGIAMATHRLEIGHVVKLALAGE